MLSYGLLWQFVDQLPLHHANRLENADIKKLLEDYKADSKLEEEVSREVFTAIIDLLSLIKF